MGTANTLLVISDNQEEISKFRSKLMLLRDIDSLMESTLDSAIESCKKHIPDTVIIFAAGKNEKILEICKAIRFDPVLKNTPIIFMLEQFDEEYLVSCFDAGISDYICQPAKDSDILMRVIWCLKKSETSRELEKKQNLLCDLGVIDPETKAYMPNYTSKVFSNEIATAQKYKTALVLMALSVDNVYKNQISDKFFAGILNKSIRNSDILAMRESGKFYVILPKTNIEGINTIYERINLKAGSEFTVSAGACQLQEGMTFNELSNLTLSALDEALSIKNTVIITTNSSNEEKKFDDWLDKSQLNTKNYKLFKQEFAKKLDTVIAPVFLGFQKKLENKYDKNIAVIQQSSDSNCEFSIKDEKNGKEAILKITDSGMSKIIIDLFYTNGGRKSNNRSKIDLPELNKEILLDKLEKISARFEEFATEIRK